MEFGIKWKTRMDRYQMSSLCGEPYRNLMDEEIFDLWVHSRFMKFEEFKFQDEDDFYCFFF